MNDTLDAIAFLGLAVLQEGPKAVASPLEEICQQFQARLPESLQCEWDLRSLQGEAWPSVQEAALEATAGVQSGAEFLSSLLFSHRTPHRRKQSGIVYTPPWLARRMANEALAFWRRLHRTGGPPRGIFDFSCGPGIFLEAVGQTFPDECPIVGVDTDPRAVRYAKLLGWMTGQNWHTACADSLTRFSPYRELFQAVDRAEVPVPCDVIIGNPPYVRSPLLPEETLNHLRRNYPSIQRGAFDLSVAFLDHAIDTLQDGGIASYVTSSKFMASSYGRDICKRLANDVRLLRVDDFGDAQVFHGHTTYTCVVTFAKRSPTKRFQVSRPVAAGKQVGQESRFRIFTLGRERITGHPWQFADDEEHRILRLLSDSRHPPLELVFGRILQGVRTGANPVFVLDRDAAARLEPALLRPFINGEHVRRFHIDQDQLRLIFPYAELDCRGLSLIPEEKLRRSAPRCWAHLQEHKEALLERAADGLDQGWHGFSRSQNLELARMPKILVREMLPRAEFAYDAAGDVTFVSGYALDARRLSEEVARRYCAILNTPTMEFSMRQHGTQLQSGWFRLLKHHLRNVRVPELSLEEEEEATRLADRLASAPGDQAALDALDEIVAGAFGLTGAQRERIALNLTDCHVRSLKRPEGEDGDTAGEASGRDLRYEPIRLARFDKLHRDRADLRRLVTFVPNKAEPLHRWFKYTQGYSAGLVEALLPGVDMRGEVRVLDPFVGCGTTSLACRTAGFDSVGVEVSPLMVWVARTKCKRYAAETMERLVKGLSLPGPREHPILDLTGHPFAAYLTKAYSTPILRQLWGLGRHLDDVEGSRLERDFLKLGLLSIMEDVSQVRKHGSHYRYMLDTKNIGLQKLNIAIIPPDTDIRPILLARLMEMVQDIKATRFPRPLPKCEVLRGDARDLPLDDASVDLVITSPPYLNRNIYLAQQKAELALMSLVTSKVEYRGLVRETLCSHVEGIFPPGGATSRFRSVRKILEALELTEKNNAKIPNMIAGYFEDMAQVLEQCFRVLRRGGQAHFVVGNSRWGGIVVPVDHILLEIAEAAGFVPRRVLVTRLKGNSPQQMRRYGRIPVRESIIQIERQ